MKKGLTPSVARKTVLPSLLIYNFLASNFIFWDKLEEIACNFTPAFADEYPCPSTCTYPSAFSVPCQDFSELLAVYHSANYVSMDCIQKAQNSSLVIGLSALQQAQERSEIDDLVHDKDLCKLFILVMLVLQVDEDKSPDQQNPFN